MGDFAVAVGAMAVMLLALNAAASDWHPMVRFLVAAGVALAVLGLVRRLVDRAD